MKHILTCIWAGVAISSIAPANDILPAPKPEKPILLQGGTIHPVTRTSITDGKLLIRDGRIAGVGRAGDVFEGEDEAVTISIEGDHVYPGLISANGTLGLVEIDSVRATIDLSEPGALNPSVRAEVAVNPDSELLPVARANGVLTTLTVPQTGGLIGGRSALLALDGWTWEEMVVKAPVGMHLDWPRMRQSATASEQARRAQRENWEERLEELRDFFDEARAYRQAKRAGSRELKSDVRFESMLPVLDKQLPLFIHALAVVEIQNALQFVQEQDVKAVLVSGQDVWRVAPLLKERGIPVILSTVQDLPMRRWEPYDTARSVPGRLREAGVPFCIANEARRSGSSSARNLPYVAASAVNDAFTAEDALKSITIDAARILGVADQLGSLETGKQATLIVTSSNPLEITTQVKRAFIRGREIDLGSKHTQLYEKYLEKQRRMEE